MVRNTFLAALGLIGAALPAYAAPGWNNQPQPLVQTIEIGVDRPAANETFPLRQLGGIGQQYNGRALHAVEVELNGSGPAAQVQLLVDGQVVDSAFTAGQQSVVLNPDPNDDVFGQQIQTLRLRTVGWVAIDDINVELWHQINLPQPQPQPQPVCQAVERQLNAEVRFTQLNLNDLFDLSLYPDCAIDSVTVTGNSAFGGGQASPLVNGWQGGNWTQFAAFPGQHTLDLWSDPVAGPNAQLVALNMMGLFNVQTVRLNLIAN